MRFRSNSNSSFRARQSRQFSQACTKPEVKFEYLMEHEGTKYILTDHARAQAVKRHGMPIEQMKSFFIKAHKGLSAFTWTEYNQEVFVYSRSYQRGCIVAARRDYKNQSNQRLGYVIVTVYPYGISKPAHPDTEIIYVD